MGIQESHAESVQDQLILRPAICAELVTENLLSAIIPLIIILQMITILLSVDQVLTCVSVRQKNGKYIRIDECRLIEYIFNIYTMRFMKSRCFVSENQFYRANSARYCDSKTNTCKCSATAEKCTGQTTCSEDGSCQGKNIASYCGLALSYH